MNLFFDLFAALSLAVPGDLGALTGDSELLAELQALLITGTLDGLELLSGQVAGSLELRFLQKQGLSALFGTEALLPELFLHLSQVRFQAILTLGVKISLERELSGELVADLM